MTQSLKHQFETIQLVYQHKTPAINRPDASDPFTLYQLMMKEWDQGELDLIEETKLLLLDRSNRLMSIYSLSKGGMDSEAHILDPKVIFAAALTRKAHQIIIVQNYPGGVFDPAYVDRGIVNQISEGGFILDIPLIDYMVITPNGYFSLLKNEEEGFVNAPSSSFSR